MTQTVRITKGVLEALKELHEKVAQDTWPDGIEMVCLLCGQRKHYTPDDCAHFLQQGWPNDECCGVKMTVVADVSSTRD